ncbi:ACR3 family arsenite efflux transporter [Altererythrobacter lauratis]|uniref:ACR3 family arsenite efflux transporter n=1 Tax=Alteraurantiacibacter lauratis TaxID=2054627 RepID=A0ABV7EAA1_9SPHN
MARDEAAVSPLGVFERWLSLWVALAIGAGIILGNIAPDAEGALASLEFASVNLVVTVLIGAMIFPMMVGVDFASVRNIGKKPKGLIIALVINWLVKPFTMAAISILFFDYLYAGILPREDARQYIAGLILLGAAPCAAMVFVRSQMTIGDPAYTLVHVPVNDLVMIVAFAPIVALLLGVTDIAVPWQTLLLSVVLYVVVPLVAGAIARERVIVAHGGDASAVDAFTATMKPWSVTGLLATVVLLFAFQAGTITSNPLLIGLIAVPIIIQSYGIFAAAWAWAWKVPLNIAAPRAMIGTSNFFELAVAVATGLFGLSSGAALATVAGVLVEVPDMLSLVAFADATRGRFGAD